METISVQEMVKKAINEIPKQYIVHEDQDEPLCHNISFAPIPIIDMNSLLADEEDTNLSHFHSACKDWGIFQVVNHGVDTQLVEKLKYEIEEFYKLPLEEKLRYKIRVGEVEGYGRSMLASASSGDDKIDWADRFYIITNPTHRRKNHLLPNLPSSLRETLEAYLIELQKLSRAIFGLIAKTLKIDPKESEEMFENGMQSVRMTYYPPCPNPDKVHGITPHSDGSGITILLEVNGVEGLQIKKDGVWMPVKFLKDAFVVNIGDIVEILSNGLYKSIEHKASVNSEKERISIGMFFNPKFEAEVGPSSSLLVKQPPLFRRVTMEQFVKDFFSQRLNGKSFVDYMRV